MFICDFKKDDMIYWKETSAKKALDDEKRSSQLEITAYIMLSKLVDMKKSDLAKVVSISRWISSQRNSLGGFYSTQDTVVAIDALAEFASSTYVKNTSLDLTYYFNGVKNLIRINDLNRLLLRKIRLDKFSERADNVLSFEVKGTGVALVQVESNSSNYLILNHLIFLN